MNVGYKIRGILVELKKVEGIGPSEYQKLWQAKSF